MSSSPQVLLSECRDIARERLADVIAGALRKIDEDLFLLAEKSGNGKEQKVYLDAMGKVREHRDGIRCRFEQCFGDLFEQRLHPVREQAAANSWGGVELSLVSHSKIEGGMEINRLAKGVMKSADDGELLGIRARLGHLLARDSLQDADNPLSPELIFEALKLACHEIPAGASVKQAVLSAFQPYLRASINDVYRAVNQNLVAHHILPQIRHSVKAAADPLGRSGRVATLGQSQNMATLRQSQRMGLLNHEQAAPGAGERSGWLAGTATRAGGQSLGYLLTGLTQGLAGARIEAIGMFADPQRFPEGPGVVPPSALLLDSLSRLQGQDSAAQAPGAAAASYLRQIDRALVAQGTPLDQLTLELVTVVFDYLLGSTTLAEPVKGVISRLQIVAIKTALLDRSFFARREHPMRRLLDRMAAAGADPLVDCATDSVFMQGLRKLAERLCTDFRDDCSVVNVALAELERLVAELAEVCDAAVLPSTEALAASEAATGALAAAQSDVALRLRESTPAFVRDFLSTWWTEAVALAERSGGGDARGAEARLALASDLVWSVEPKSRSDVITLATTLPLLVRGLMQGTRDVGMPEQPRNGFFSELMAAHTDAIAAAKRAGADLKTAPRPGAADAARRAPEPVAASTDPYDCQVATLTKGAMVEFSDERMSDRFRLGWVSPKRTFYVFIGGGRMRQLSADQLAAFFRQGVATLASSEAPIVDRALESLSLDFCAMPVAA